MDLDYNNKLKAIMAKHNTDVWNDDCKNDPEYAELSNYLFHGEEMKRETERAFNESLKEPKNYNATNWVDKKVIRTEKLKDGRTRNWLTAHTEPNRKARRIPKNAGNILNQRRQTSGRGIPHRVLTKMSYFHLQIAAKTGRL